MTEDDRDVMKSSPKLKASIDGSHRVSRDETVNFTIDPSAILVFDADTGVTL